MRECHWSPPLLQLMLALIPLRFLFPLCNGTFSLCFSGQLIAKGEGFSHRYKQPIVCFFSYWLQTHALPLCDIPLCGEREREPHHEWRSMLFKQHTLRSHQNPVMPKAPSCPHIPHRCLGCRLLIKLICWLRDTQEGWEFGFLCPAIGLSWRGSTALAASFTSE